ncbi:MAG: MASE1 domain-containing protein [Solirubrobacteraceae bacterium]
MTVHRTASAPTAVLGVRPFGRQWRQHVVLPGRGDLLPVAGLVGAYYAAAHLGYAFEFSGPIGAIVWLPVGVGIAFLYLGGMQLWPGVVIGDLLVNDYSALPVGSALAQSLGNLLEVLVATWLLLRLCPRKEPLSTLRGVAGMLAAVACGTLVSATIGSLASWIGGAIDGHSVPYVWRTWWLGDFTGALILVPLVLSWSLLPRRPWPRARLLEAGLMMTVVVGLSALQLGEHILLAAVVFPALIWAALSFGLRGATLATMVICGFALVGATNDLGPFGVGSISSRLLETQLFIATASLCGLAVAALVSERGRLAEGLRESRVRLVAASDLARQRVERDLHDGAQQGLVGLKFKLAEAGDVILANPAEGRRLVAVVERQMDSVLDEVRSVAHGVYPPLLRERGIVEALRSARWLSATDVSVHGRDVGRYSQVIESAVYFCCLEAIQNVAKHAGPDAHADVTLWQQRSHLRFAVTDSGAGFDSTAVSHGDGLANMRDRIEAIGGTLTVTSSPGSGSSARGSVPATPTT